MCSIFKKLMKKDCVTQKPKIKHLPTLQMSKRWPVIALLCLVKHPSSLTLVDLKNKYLIKGLNSKI